ncbi:MAG TPA: hypothetical protein VFO00_05160 [Vitreimonas sp.]|nr:hypothetical protein [Vitreimonas sp.]
MTITANTSLRRKLAALFCVPSAATLAAASGFAVVLVNGPMVQPANAEAVADCLELVRGNDEVVRLFNACPFTVEAVWCVENIDCNGGRFTNMATIHSMRENIVHGGASGNTVHWGACRGANTISHYGTTAYSYEFHCTG